MRRVTLGGLGLAIGILAAWPASAEAQCGGFFGYGPDGYREFFSPYKFQRQPRLHAAPNGTGLQYYRFMYPYSDYHYYKRTYPHTFRGMLGQRPQPRDLTLRFRVSPGFSPFSRYHFDERLFGEGPVDTRSPDGDGYESGALRELFRDIARPLPRAAPDAGGGSHRVFVPGAKSRDKIAPSSDELRAWSMLGETSGREAMDAFATVTMAYPSLGRPRAGWGLAWAFGGDDGEAVRKMRHALRVEGASLRSVPVDDELEQKLRSLLTRYADGGPHQLSETDATFMTAALHFVLDEPQAARDAVRAGVEQGDFDASTLQLLRLLLDKDEIGIPRRPGQRASTARNGV